LDSPTGSTAVELYVVELFLCLTSNSGLLLSYKELTPLSGEKGEYRSIELLLMLSPLKPNKGLDDNLDGRKMKT